MILTFSNPRFVEQILSGEKIHTIRRDEKNRWQAGKKIHFWLYNPRNTSKNPYQFHEAYCMGVQEVKMKRWNFLGALKNDRVIMNIDKMWVPQIMIESVAENDGLTYEELREWFVPEEMPSYDGKIIHWTILKY